MRIAKLTVHVGDSGIAYNNGKELGTTAARGVTLADGKVVRGLGTHFASQEAKEKYDLRQSEANEIRAKFNRRFSRFVFDSAFVLSRKGEAKEFAASITVTDPNVTIEVLEFEVGADEEMGEREMKDWSERVKNQLKQVPLGRGEDADTEGLAALETLAGCPVLSPETAARIRLMVSEVRIGKMTRTDLKRGILLMDVEIDQSALLPQRGRPELVP